MPKQQERVLIAGGGIGGLAASIALARRGIESEVLERSRFSEETGAGIQLGPNATRALAALGVLEAIGARAFKPDAIAIYDGLTGRKLTSLPLGKSVEDRYGAPYLTLHRADLHAGLRAAAESLAPVTLRPGFEVSAVDTQGADMLVRGIDGSEANGAALVGADGLWSAVRPLIAPAASLRFTGATAWRTLLPRAGASRPVQRVRGRALARAARASRALPGPRRRRPQCRRRDRRRRRAARLEPDRQRRNFARRVHGLDQGFEIIAANARRPGAAGRSIG